jgi:hypothetical protein
MAVTTAISVASFSIVLAETFGAVMLSTLIPATFVETASTMKRLAKKHVDAHTEPTQEEKDGALSVLKSLPGIPAISDALENVAMATAEPTNLNLLLPKQATIDAEFEFHGSESYAYNANVGAQVKLVTVEAGYSALYTVSSSNKIKLHIEFETVNITIAP